MCKSYFQYLHIFDYSIKWQIKKSEVIRNLNLDSRLFSVSGVQVILIINTFLKTLHVKYIHVYASLVSLLAISNNYAFVYMKNCVLNK
jgi:hypothetical protein